MLPVEAGRGNEASAIAGVRPCSVAPAAHSDLGALCSSASAWFILRAGAAAIPRRRRRGSIDGLRPMRILSPPFQRARVMSFISRVNFCKAVVVCVAVVAGLPLAGAREFRVADTQSEDYPTVQALMFMARLVEERTGGRHHIRVFHSRQLGEEKDTIKQ